MTELTFLGICMCQKLLPKSTCNMGCEIKGRVCTTHSHPKASPLTMLQYLTF